MAVIRHRHQHIKPSAKKIAKAHILKADIFTLEKPDISTLGLQHLYINRNISNLLKSEKCKNEQKADFETSRLFYEQF